MKRLTPEQRYEIVKKYFEHHGSVRNTYRALRPFYGQHNRPSEQLIRLTMERFRTTFTLNDDTHLQRRRTVRTEEVIAAVERSVEKDPNQSIRHHAQELDMCPSTMWKILRKSLDDSQNMSDGGGAIVEKKGRGRRKPNRTQAAETKGKAKKESTKSSDDEPFAAKRIPTKQAASTEEERNNDEEEDGSNHNILLLPYG